MRIQATIATLFLLLPVGTHAQQVKKSAVSGTIVTASVAVAPSTCSALYMPPAGQFLIVTQLCTTTFTRGEFTPSNTDIVKDQPCTTYSPGMTLPAGETGIRCCNVSGSTPFGCTMTGVLSKK